MCAVVAIQSLCSTCTYARGPTQMPAVQGPPLYYSDPLCNISFPFSHHVKHTQDCARCACVNMCMLCVTIDKKTVLHIILRSACQNNNDVCFQMKYLPFCAREHVNMCLHHTTSHWNVFWDSKCLPHPLTCVTVYSTDAHTSCN